MVRNTMGAMRIIRRIIVCALALMLLPIRSMGEGTVEIKDRVGLEAIARDPFGSYVLAADIDLGRADWVPFAFYGCLDGGGHTLYNLRVADVGSDRAATMDGNHIRYESAFAGLFSVVRGASVTNLRLVGARVEVESEIDCYAAVLAGYADCSTFTDCTVSGRVTLTTTAKAVGVGGLVGFCDQSEFERCTADTELCFIDRNRELDCEQFLGGLFACGYGKMLDCSVRLRGFASVFGYAHNGGMVGLHLLTRKTEGFRAKLARCTVDAEITFFERVASRRAYCEALIGENFGGDCYLTTNTVVNFVRSEVYSYDSVLLPEGCSSPEIKDVVTPPTCTDWGCTTHTCTICGHSFTDSYTPPAHNFVPVIERPADGRDGSISYVCSACGLIDRTEPLVGLNLKPLVRAAYYIYLLLSLGHK